MKDELPEYAKKYGGDVINMTVEEEAEFLMQCNEMENMPNIPEALEEFDKMGIPMYVLSNSGFTAQALEYSKQPTLGAWYSFQRRQITLQRKERNTQSWPDQKICPVYNKAVESLLSQEHETDP